MITFWNTKNVLKNIMTPKQINFNEDITLGTDRNQIVERPGAVELSRDTYRKMDIVN